MKNLSLNLSAQSSPTSSVKSGFSSLHSGLPAPSAKAFNPPPTPSGSGLRFRRPSVVSLPPKTAALVNRKENVDPENTPYADGPVQILPGIWLGSEDNARDFTGLAERKIKAILNVAKEVASPFDLFKPLRSFASTPNLNAVGSKEPSDSTYYPPHLASGRPGMHYLKLMWSHGQQDLVARGFPEAMAFTDAAAERGDGVLIHCQCGISRSATMVIALVMRAAAMRSPHVPDHVWALKGMQPAYDYVKQKSTCIGPNMSLIYQLLDYERKLTGGNTDSERSSIAEEEEEWGRRRKMMEEEQQDDGQESTLVMEEAQALDRAMEDRIASRKSSASSLGMGAAWRSRYGHNRKRTGSIASTSNNSILSEDLIEVDEERSLLGVGGGFFTDESGSLSSANSPDDDGTTRYPPPSAPIWKTSFNLPPPPASANRATFELGASKGKRRPSRLLPPVPSSPTNIIVDTSEQSSSKPPIPRKPSLSLRMRSDSRKPAPPPLHLRHSVLQKANSNAVGSTLNTPSQTLFVFPPSPTLPSSRTPSTMTLSNMAAGIPFPAMTPRVSTFRSHGRTRSFIGIAAPPTPTTAYSKVDAKGYLHVGE
ncbi:phosphatases II [Hymenopellis radicata]|nr:phosphatases II [Hymenopellis radicata]